MRFSGSTLRTGTSPAAPWPSSVDASDASPTKGDGGMSDQDVLLAVKEMEAWLARGALLDDPGLVEQWHKKFLAALAGAERGADWPAILERVHALATRLDQQVSALESRKESLRKELQGQAVGRRALKAYKPMGT